VSVPECVSVCADMWVCVRMCESARDFGWVSVLEHLQTLHTIQVSSTHKICFWKCSADSSMSGPNKCSSYFLQNTQCAYRRNTLTRSRNHCCRGKKISIKYMSVCLCSCPDYRAFESHLFCTALYFHLWPLWLHRIFVHYLKKARFSEKCDWIQNVCFDFLYNFCL
jgi:hypothetical protein